MPFSALIVGPTQSFVNIGTHGFVAHRMHGHGTAPSAMALALVPAAGKHMILAVRAFDDFSVPIAPLFHGRVFEAVMNVARADRGCAPGGR